MKLRDLVLSIPLFLGGCGIIGNNFHDIGYGSTYRSAQLDKEDLQEKIKKHRIRSVLNLRGQKEGKEWYDDEYQVCKKNSVKLYNIRMSARRLPYKDTIEQILDVFDNGPYPLLIHCKAGSDRTGLVSALYKIHVLFEPVEKADDELSIWYGHISIPKFDVFAMDQFLIMYQQSKTKNLREFLKTYIVKKNKRKKEN